MNNCGSCGSDVPEGQRFCSMCYGDPYYGNDGYYLSYLEDMERAAWEKANAEQQEVECFIQEEENTQIEGDEE